MRLRRWILASGLFALCARSLAAAPASDVQAAAYGGGADGQWTCGPKGSVKYGGLGGQARIQTAPEPSPYLPPVTGWHVDLKANVERRAYRLECVRGPDCRASDGWYEAGSAVVGIDWKYFGLSAGLTGVTLVSEEGRRSPALFPEVRLRSPRIAGHTRLELGFGTPTVTATSRPGLYLASRTGLEQMDVLVAVGLQRVFEDTYSPRGEVQVRAAVGRSSWLGMSAAGQGDSQFHPEGGLLFGGRL